jgi:bifunctional UDP-N-acetylglucosamine pyrophosphorylase/glucosamine-1-phosphate N-acetyltransferase
MIKIFRKIKYLIKYPLSRISSETEIGPGTKIKPFVYITGKVKIGKNCEIGPFSRIREITEIKDNVFIGHFVEIKNSFIDENTKIGHLTYVGDAEVGKSVNIGAGVITCNYDGVTKHKTTVEDCAFIGTNNSLVAPVKIGKNAYTAAGSVITENVPPYALGIGRAKQVNKLMWVKEKGLEKSNG